MTDLNDPVIRGYLLRLVGEEGVEMMEKMPEGEVTDEEIAEASGVLLNIVRRTLFILYENKLAVCRRERDSSSGWLTYLWHLDLSDITSQLEKERKRLIRHLESRLDFEEDNVFYSCPEGCLRMVFNDAVECEFLCLNCGEDLVFEDNTLPIKKMQKRVEELKQV